VNRIPERRPNGFDPEDLASVMRRMGDAGWLEGNNAVTSKEVLFHWSEKGFQKMRVLNDLLKSFPEGTFTNPDCPIKLADLMKLISELIKLAPEIISPPLSGQENQALLEVIFAFDSENPGGSTKRF
jgi:hypothetical protein